MVLKKLNYHIREKARYALFLGAGASVESGGRTAEEIAFEILRRLYGIKPDRELINLFQAEYKRSINFEDILGALCTGKSEQMNILRNFFADMSPSEGYRYFAPLLKAGYFYPIVLTTNIDSMIEDALRADKFLENCPKIRILVQEEVNSASIEPELDEIIIVKLHGDISNPVSLKVTSSETASISEYCEKLIIRLCENQGVIVMGYRAKDIGVRNAFQKAKFSGKGLYWISRYPPDATKDREIYLLLEQHNSRNNIISGMTFDDVLKKIGTPFIKAQIRGKYNNQLNDAWKLLDYSRSFGKKRASILEELDKQSKMMLDTKLEEVLALREFVQYELDRSGEIYRLQQGTNYLEIAINEYFGYIDEVHLDELEYALLGELLNLFLTGDQIQGGRLAHLDQLIDRGEKLLKRIPSQQIVLKGKCLIALGEAYKEKSMITENPEKNNETYTSSRTRCEKAISLLKEREDWESKYLLGAAYRHLAVTYELEADGSNEEERKSMYENWRNYSSRASQILQDLDENAVRGYALMNLSSSYTRLHEYEVHDQKKKELLETGKNFLKDAIKLLRDIEDHRGIGWAFVHFCENTRKRIELSDPNERSSLFEELESYANKAIAELRRVGDHLAQGLAYEQLGIALYKIFSETDLSAQVKLERAIMSLREGIKMLRKTGYYRGTGEASLWIGRCRFAMWKQNSDIKELLNAIQSFTGGIVSTAIGLKSSHSLEPLYRSLEEQLRKLL